MIQIYIAFNKSQVYTILYETDGYTVNITNIQTLHEINLYWITGELLKKTLILIVFLSVSFINQ